ncbi:MAG TPA: TRAM domain-containing protein [Methylomirabilota bacterium]|nr:TRAM domain-containing protein [Methylomirabilota bacterium]
MRQGRARQRSVARTVELEIQSIGARGDGIGRVDGRPVYVPLSQVGDRLRVRLEMPRGDGTAGRILEVLAPGRGRVPAPCPHFGECGGCALQHIDDGHYAAWKVAQVQAALQRRGFAEPPLRPLVRVAPGTRRRATLAAERAGRAIRVGFHARGSHRVVDATGCLVLTPALLALLPPLQAALPAVLAEGERIDITVTSVDAGIDLVLAARRGLDLTAREVLAALARESHLARVTWLSRDAPDPIAAYRPVQATFGGVAVDLPPGAFLQPTAAGEAALVAAVTEALGRCTQVGDLYAGCGTFTFPLARTARVHAVEGDGAAAAALIAAARRADLTQSVTAAQRDLARDPLTADELARFEGVVFDPPRAGARAQAEMLARSTVGTVVAVSCDPATFARDTRILVDGGYRLLSVTPVDQFIWSPHLELVAVFRR